MASYVQFRRYGKRRKGWHTIVFPRKKHRPSELLEFVQVKDRPGHYAYRTFDQYVLDRPDGGVTRSRAVPHFQFYFTDQNVAFEFKVRFG